jgi:peptide/nickel transport system permease protein
MSVILFAMVNVLPGDVAVMILGTRADEEKLALLRQQLGLNLPIWVRYFDWLSGAITGDLGQSLRFGDSVGKLIMDRLPASMFLAFVSIIFSVGIAIPLGIIAAIGRNTWKDTITSTIAFLGISLPDFFWGIILILVFAEYLNIFPPSGYVNPIEHPVSGLSHIILPALSMSLILMAHLARMERSSLLEELRSDYIQLARSKGLKERVIIFRHALPNAILPVLTVAGIQLGYLFGGIVVIEELFAYPGMGRLAFQALLHRDVPLIVGTVLVIGIFFMTVNLIVDLLYAIIDPRTTARGEGK